MELPRLKLYVGGYAAFSVALVLVLLLDAVGSLRAVQQRSGYEHDITDKLVDNLAEARLEAVKVQQFITDAAATGNKRSVDEALLSVGRAQRSLNNVAQLDTRLGTQAQQLRHDIEQLYITGQVMVEAYASSREEGNAIMRAPNGFDVQVEGSVEHLRRLATEVEEISRATLAEQDAALERSKVQIGVLGSILCLLSVFAGFYLYRQVFSALNARERALQSLLRVQDELLPARDIQGTVRHSDIEALSQAIVTLVQEREENRRSILRAKDAAESSDRAKTEFLASLSHEVRTPLNGVLGMADLLEMGTLDAEQTVALKHLRESAQALLTLLLRLLEYSHIEAGKVSIERTAFSVSELVLSLARKCEPRALAKGLQFYCSVAPEVPAAVLGDEAHIGQVLLELLDNAIKFTDAGSVRLEAWVTPDATLPHLCFTVADSGPGIAEEHHELMFQAFKQIDGSMTRSHGGVGLGLALCRALAHAMHAEIRIEPGSGQGARFTLDMPLST